MQCILAEPQTADAPENCSDRPQQASVQNRLEWAPSSPSGPKMRELSQSLWVSNSRKAPRATKNISGGGVR